MDVLLNASLVRFTFIGCSHSEPSMRFSLFTKSIFIAACLGANTPYAMADDDAPTLNAISIDKLTVDVTEEPQTVTISVDASDESGVDWENIYSFKRSEFLFRDAGGTLRFARGSNETPGVMTISISNEDVGGDWQVVALNLVDVNGNHRRISNLSDYGMPDSIEVIGGTEADAPILNAISIDKETVDVTEEPQTVAITVDASDESGVDWENIYSFKRSQLVLRDAGGTFHYARGSNETPGVMTISISSDNVGGEWLVVALDLVDVHGNHRRISNLSDYGMPESIEIIGGKEADAPILNAISINKATVDVREEAQTVSVTVDASDESGVDWENRYSLERSELVLTDGEGGFHYIRGSNDTPGIMSTSVSSGDVGGAWRVRWLDLVDVNGNHRKISNLSDYGLPTSLYILKADEPTSDISVSYTGLYETLGEDYDYEMVVTAENLAAEATTSLDLSISTSNLRVTSVSRDNGSQACSLVSTNYDSTVSCTVSAIQGNSSATIKVALTAGATGTSWINLKLVDDLPDITFLDNYIYLKSTVQNEADSDGDGTPDNLDAFPLDPSETTDTDGDGVGNNADTDDDNDGVSDSEDAFPLDSTETVDTDNDGIGNNEDTDDDNDGYSDSSDAFPLDASEWVDTDSDGIGNNEDTDDDGDGATDEEESAAGSDPLDPTSLPGSSDEESDGLPVWMLYIASQTETEIDTPIGPPSLDKCGEDRFGRVNCDELSTINLPYSSSGSQAISRIPRPAYFTFGTFILSAESNDYRIAELVAEDRNGRVTPQIYDLSEGDVITEGQTVQFTLRSPPTNGQQTRLRFYIRFEGASGQTCENCTLNLERVFTSN